MPRRVVVIGLDCVAPTLAFDQLRAALPNLRALIARGCHGPLRSSVPPITVPAWTCMFSGHDAGELGLYGFRNRTGAGHELSIASSRDVHVTRTWERAGQAGKRVATLFVPLTYPPTPVNGCLISGLLTPTPERVHTHPAALGERLARTHGPYRMDVEGFRSEARLQTIEALGTMTRQHFAIARELYRAERPDLMTMVEIGPDRLHHVAWHALDRNHRRHDADGALAAAARGYYRMLDHELGALISLLDDDTVVIVVSDHGARPLCGGIAINEWLRARGDLVLSGPVDGPTPPAQMPVDWSRTRAWAEGGYYARIFLNVAGREPEGIIPAHAREQVRDELLAALHELPGPEGEPLEHRLVVPEQAFRATRGRPPDIMAFLGDLDYRAIGSVGLDAIHLPDNDTGPDACNHDWDGIFVMAGPDLPARGAVSGYTLYDVNRTVLGLMDIPCPDDLLGVDRSRHP